MGSRIAHYPMILACASAAGWAVAVTPTAEELAHARRWSAEHLRRARVLPEAPDPTRASASLPFAFVYGGRHADSLLPTWGFRESVEQPDTTHTRRTHVYTDPDTGMEVRCVSNEYHDVPTVEWTVYCRNSGPADSPILEGLQALDLHVRRGADGEFLLHHSVGSPCRADDYRPQVTALEPGAGKRLAAAGGRPTSSDLCYANLEWPTAGLIVALGWPGQWAADFQRDNGDGLRLVAGQELTRFRLRPGEEVRTPLVALLFWQGDDWLRAQNLWRRWFLAHGIRRPGGQLPPAQWCGTSETGTNMMVEATEQNQRTFVDAYLERGWKPDFWWMDAGWYPCQGDWTRTGTWEADPQRFPQGLRPVFEYLHAKGIRGILWFEPERVRAGTWLATQRPEWVLAGGADGLLDLGNPAAREWLTDHVDRLLTEFGVDIYRQDFNMDPLACWRAADGADRQGITENRYVTGLLAYWDELLRRHPGMLYDNCASGGRRNDLESMRRGVPYTKSDYATDPVGVQGQTYGISLWLPYFAATWGTSDDPYLCRSRLAHVVGACLDLRVEGHLGRLAQRLEEWRTVTPCYWGDFWPLTPYSLDNAAWIAWQFDLPDAGTGVVQAFRRADCPADSVCLRLRGLDPAAPYTFTDSDGALGRTVAGAELMASGLPLSVSTRPAALLLRYRRHR